MRWSFAKYVGSGNDFIHFDNRQNQFPLFEPFIIRDLCHRQLGIGADGVILLENSAKADFRMRIFNSDGTEAEMCGNGLRCFIKWLMAIGLQLPSYRVEVMNRILTASQIGNLISIQMGDPTNIEWNISLQYEDQTLHLHHLNTGVPHTILFSNEMDNLKLEEMGPYIRYHPQWQPQGTNITVAKQIGPKKIKVRTYERGVEKETLSCGTGATAAALAAAFQCKIQSPVMVQTLSGEELSVGFLQRQGAFTNVTLTGPAHFVFHGEIHLPENSPFSIASKPNLRL
jgi:diaminopimelate epimerase